MSSIGKNSTILEINQHIGKTIEALYDTLKIGKFEVIVNNKNMPYRHDVIYEHKDGFNNNYKYECELDINTSDFQVRFNYYSAKDYRWSKDEFLNVLAFIKILNNIYSGVHAKRIIDYTAYLDEFTGLLNFPGMIYKFEHNINKYEQHNYSCLFISLKNFIYVNQFLGMTGGNKILELYGKKLESLLSEEEICGRLGGDNFIVFIKSIKVDLFIQNLKDVRLMYDNGEIVKEFVINCRVGISDWNTNISFTDVLDQASIALNYAKKHAHRDYYRFNDKIRKEMMHKKTIKNDFPNALVNHEFILKLQPKIDSITNKVYGAEALVRWIHDGQEIYPNDFIPILEEDETICELDFYVLDLACKTIKSWIDRGLDPIPISVNFAKNHLQDEDVARKIMTIIYKNRVRPDLIEIELTETSAIYNKQALLLLVLILKDNDVKVSLDDFGTGYSSLNLLKELDVDVVKIDKTFVDNVENEKDNMILGHVITMIKHLNIDVIAEGIENKKQLECVQELGCNKVQGYYYYKPLFIDEFESEIMTIK